MLPKIKHPTFFEKLPLSGLEVKFRPFTVKEEKILLIASKSDNKDEIINAIETIVRNCAMDEEMDVENLPLVDLEYIFLKIRANSVNNIINLTITDEEDGNNYSTKVDINDIQIKNADRNKEVEIGDGYTLKLKYPSIKMLKNLKNDDTITQDETLLHLIIQCFDSVYNDNELHNFKDSSKEEIDEFMENFDSSIMNELREFFQNLPSIILEVKYETEDGTTKTKEVRGTENFFQSA